MAYELRDKLPWETIADSWQAAEEALAQLDQRLADSPLRAAWMNRAHFREACAALWLEGEVVSLEELVLHDAETAPTLPSQALFRARAVLLSRRAIARQGPAETLSREGLLGLQERRFQLGRTEVSEVLDHDPDWGAEERLAEWREVLGRLDDLPALPAAALAFKAWQDIEPLQYGGPAIGRLAVSVMLWQRGKIQGPVLCLNLGFRQKSWVYRHNIRLAEWMRTFFEAVTAAAKQGMDEHSRLVLASELIARRAQGRRQTSRFEAMGQLLLEHPLVSAPMAAEKLGISQQGAANLLKEHALSGVRELTGRARFRAYAII